MGRIEDTRYQIHRDPFDRLIVATALAEQITIITADEIIGKYTAPYIL